MKNFNINSMKLKVHIEHYGKNASFQGYCQPSHKCLTTKSNDVLTSQLSKLAGVGAVEADTDPSAFIADFQKPTCDLNVGV